MDVPQYLLRGTWGMHLESIRGLLGVSKCARIDPFCSNFSNQLCTEIGQAISPIRCKSFIH